MILHMLIFICVQLPPQPAFNPNTLPAENTTPEPKSAFPPLPTPTPAIPEQQPSQSLQPQSQSFEPAPLKQAPIDSGNFSPDTTIPKQPMVAPNQFKIKPNRAPSKISDNIAPVFEKKPVFQAPPVNSSLTQPMNTMKSQVRPATFVEPASQLAGNGLPTVKSQLQEILIPARKTLLPGSPLSLTDALQKRFDSTTRVKIVRAYWDLTIALADLEYANHEQNSILGIKARQNVGQAKLKAEVAACKARFAEAKLSAYHCQEQLHQILGLTGNDPMSVPSTDPYTNRYQTNYDKYKESGHANENLRRIDRLLPLKFDLMNKRGEAVSASLAAFNEFLKVFQSGSQQVSMTDVLEKHRLLRDQEIAFLASVRDYNYSIADYAFGSVHSNGSAEQVASMLIYDPGLKVAHSKMGPTHSNLGVVTNPTQIAEQPQQLNPTNSTFQQSTIPTQPQIGLDVTR